jgi:apolipoprotein N-acyltransferase
LFSFQKSGAIHLLVAFIIFNFFGFIYGAFKSQEGDYKSLKFALIQANIGSAQEAYAKYGDRFRDAHIKRQIELSMSAYEQENYNLLIWPETSFLKVLKDNKPLPENIFASRFLDFLKKRNVSFISGVFLEGENKETSNAAFVLSPPYKKLEFYKKRRLLPFGEYLPASKIIPDLKSIFPHRADFKEGSTTQKNSFQINGMLISVIICYEGLYTYFFREQINKNGSGKKNSAPSVFINLTNDSWYDSSFEPIQHLYSVAVKAVENQTHIIRSTNTGISALINPSGEIIKPSPFSKEWAGVYQIDFDENIASRFYTQYGHIIVAPVAALLFLIFIIVLKD